MIDSADHLSLPPILHADICVVGAGPAGITLAQHLAAAGRQVLLLESGGRRPDAHSQSLCQGQVANPALHPPVDMFRRRCLGGASTIWGGRCVPFDALDFAPRPWLGLPGWPIRHTDLLPHWHRAQEILQLGAFDYDATTAIPGGMRPMLPNLRHPAISQDQIERFSLPLDFGLEHRQALASAPTLRVLLRATCTEIILTPACTAVAELRCQASGARHFAIRARHYVLATGGLEAPRLLLASRAQMPCGVGNQHNQVGRHYMSHLAGTLGVFTPAAPPWHGYERTPDGVYCRRRLTIAPWAQAQLRIGNVIARLHHPNLADPAHRTGAFSALYLARRLLPAEYTRRLTHPNTPAHVLRHAANIAANPAGTAAFAWHMLRARALARRKLPSLAIPPRAGRYTLDVHAEQLPNPASRVTLARTTDCFGVPQLHVDWRYTQADINSVRAALGLLAEALPGQLAIDPDSVEADLLRDGAYGGHHLGTARMSETPQHGVVDADCRVHGLVNLFVAGGAVFPTSGQANPTLTIVALALRLAENIESKEDVLF
jgi:choline dehydrogenase-like flavoprotein